MLAERLDTIRQGADKRIPPDKRAIMHRATGDLRASGILNGVIKVGDPLPPFALKNALGRRCARPGFWPGAVGPDTVARYLVTLLRRRAVCFCSK